MSAQEIPLKLDFRERARVNDVPVGRLIGFEAKEIADAPGRIKNKMVCRDGVPRFGPTVEGVES
jgi:hypothetical protein